MNMDEANPAQASGLFYGTTVSGACTKIHDSPMGVSKETFERGWDSYTLWEAVLGTDVAPERLVSVVVNSYMPAPYWPVDKLEE